MPKPTPSDLAVLRRLLKKAGGRAELLYWLGLAEHGPTREAHRPEATDDVWLAGCELACRKAERHGLKRHTMLKRLVQLGFGITGKGTPDSISRRVARKLRKRRLTDKELCDLLKIGDLASVLDKD